MKKGDIIEMVKITDKMVEVVNQDGENVKVTRTQRNKFLDYKNPDYLKNLAKEFSNAHVVSADFFVIRDGEYVFRSR